MGGPGFYRVDLWGLGPQSPMQDRGATGPSESSTSADVDVQPAVLDAEGGVRVTAQDAIDARCRAAACTTAHQIQLKVQAKVPVRPATAPVELFRSGHAATQAIFAKGAELTQTAAHAVAKASELNGRLTTHGTLTRQGGRWSYAQTPHDALVVVDEKGRRQSFEIETLDGNLQSVDDFFGHDHRIAFEAAGDGYALTTQTTRRGAERTAHIEGELTHGSQEYEVALDYRLRERGQYDANGGESRRSVNIDGTLKTEGATLTIRETAELLHANALRRDVLYGDVTNTSRHINNVLETDGSTYRWSGVQTRTALRDGRATDVDTYWQASGEITKDGGPYGRYRLNVTGDAAQIQMVTPDRALTVESYPLR